MGKSIIRKIIREELSYPERIKVEFYCLLIEIRRIAGKILWKAGLRNKQVWYMIHIGSAHPVEIEEA